MAKDKEPIVLAETPALNEVNTTIEVVEATPQEAVYCGPEYKRGIIIPGYTGMVRPADMDDAERTVLIQRYPPAAAWWK